MSERWDITGVDNRILEQYRDSPNLLALLRALIDDPNNELRAAFEALLTRLDIDASEGIQLDLIGSIIGRPRPTVLDPLLVQGEGFFEFRDRLDPNEPDLGFDSLIGVGNNTFAFVGFDDVDEDVFTFIGLDNNDDPEASDDRKAFGEIGQGDGGLLRSVDGIALPSDKLPDASDIQKGFGALTEAIGGQFRTTEGIVMPEPVQRNFEGAPFKGEEELPALPDPDYRELLKAAIFLNTSGASVPELEFYGRFVLGTTLTIVNGFTAIDLEVSRRISVQERAIIDATLLPAAGIKIRETKIAKGEDAFSMVGSANGVGFGAVGEEQIGAGFARIA